MLPTISPNIGAGEMRRTGMMRRFLDSLDRVAALPVRRPGRAARPRPAVFEPGRARRRAQSSITASASRRFWTCSCAADGPLTVYEIARTLWPKLPGYHLGLGTNEVNSHLEKSVEDGDVREEDGRFSIV